uniref:Uncharacterized protein n=1 Tax=Anguilla anguilla TaxID=7936 RepID=A0A0E9WI63_ANGAN
MEVYREPTSNVTKKSPSSMFDNACKFTKKSVVSFKYDGNSLTMG